MSSKENGKKAKLKEKKKKNKNKKQSRRKCEIFVKKLKVCEKHNESAQKKGSETKKVQPEDNIEKELEQI